MFRFDSSKVFLVSVMFFFFFVSVFTPCRLCFADNCFEYARRRSRTLVNVVAVSPFASNFIVDALPRPVKLNFGPEFDVVGLNIFSLLRVDIDFAFGMVVFAAGDFPNCFADVGLTFAAGIDFVSGFASLFTGVFALDGVLAFDNGVLTSLFAGVFAFATVRCDFTGVFASLFAGVFGILAFVTAFAGDFGLTDFSGVSGIGAKSLSTPDFDPAAVKANTRVVCLRCLSAVDGAVFFIDELRVPFANRLMREFDGVSKYCLRFSFNLTLYTEFLRFIKLPS